MMSLHTRNATADDHGLDKMAVRLQGLHTPLASSSGLTRKAGQRCMKDVQ